MAGIDREKVERAVAELRGQVDEALAWLDKMSHSAREVSYQGVVTFQLGGEMQVMQISHSVSDAGASESLTQLTGQGARVTRVNHPLDCIHPGHQLLRLSEEVSQSAKLSDATGTQDCGISGHYQFKTKYSDNPTVEHWIDRNILVSQQPGVPNLHIMTTGNLVTAAGDLAADILIESASCIGR